MGTPNRSRLILGGLVALAVAGSAWGQETEGPEPASASGAGDLNLRIGVGGSYLFDTDLDDGGEISIAGVGTRIGTQIEIDERNSLRFGFGYEFESYDFSGSRGLAALDPWEDVHHFAFSAIWNLELDDEWSLFAGPTIALSAEDGAVTKRTTTPARSSVYV